jgi:repressor LexA
MSKLPSLTARQHQVFEFVREHSAATGSAPTLQEIRQHFGFKSLNAAREHLRLLERKRYLARRPGHARGIQLNNSIVAPPEIIRVPLIGRIAAGPPSEAIENVESEIPLPRALWSGDNLFALRVRGDSMVGAGIFDGDIAVVNAQSEIADGKIAAVVIDQDTTLKRVFRGPRGVRLHAENPNYSDLIFDHSAGRVLRIAGVLVGTLRSF